MENNLLSSYHKGNLKTTIDEKLINLLKQYCNYNIKQNKIKLLKKGVKNDTNKYIKIIK